MAELFLHFDREEFKCLGQNCCNHSRPVHPRLIESLELLRALVNEDSPETDHPIIITSGFRCRKHNDEVKGASDSYHTLAMAADIVSPDIPPFCLARYAKQIPAFASGGIGVYHDYLHVDVRPNGPVRWSG